MTGGPYGNRSRSIHRAVVDLAASYLDQQGIASTSKRSTTTISGSLDEDVAVAPDLSIEGVDLRVSSKLRPFRLSEDLELAQRVAAIRGTQMGAVVQWRSDKDIASAYVILDLQDFSALVRGDHLAL